MGCIYRAEGTASGCVMCRIHFSCSVSLRQIQFAFHRYRGDRINCASADLDCFLGESEEQLFHRNSVDPDFLPQMLGAFCSKACGVQGARVGSKRCRTLQPWHQRLGVKLPTSLPFTRRTSIMAKDRIVLQVACIASAASVR